MKNEFIAIEDFVSDVLVGIFRGTVKANKEIRCLGGRINPGISGNIKEPVSSTCGDLVCRAEFDIAVSVSGKDGSKVKVGVFSGFLGGGAGAETENQTATVSRVKFAVPYSLPQTVDSGWNGEPTRVSVGGSY